jgi:predicted dehydrogenase
MKNDWGIVGCAYMAKEYCKVLTSKGIAPQVYSRDLTSSNVKSFQDDFPQLEVKKLAEIDSQTLNWIVCTKIESHEEVCDRLKGRVLCEKPYSLDSTYDTGKEISILMNRRYYYWVSYIKEIIDSGNERRCFNHPKYPCD